MVIEEKLAVGVEDMWIDHNVLVAHNPFAKRPLFPAHLPIPIQFMDLGTGFGWSDGERL